jgi:hypothetical protein
MVAYWTENAGPRGDFLGPTKLRNITPDQIAAYQSARIDAGRTPKTVNGKLSVLRQVLRHARLWNRFQKDYRGLRNTKPPIGQALTDDDQKKLFRAARSKREWLFAYAPQRSGSTADCARARSKTPGDHVEQQQRVPGRWEHSS